MRVEGSYDPGEIETLVTSNKGLSYGQAEDGRSFVMRN